LSTLRLSAEELNRLVDPVKLMDTIEKVLKSDAVAPVRPSVEIGGSWFSSMLAGGLGYYVVKLVGVYPNNPQRGLPLVRGEVLLFDAETGDLLMEADASTFTAWRTAAATALALRILGAKGAVLGIVGAGTQGRFHARLIKDVFNVYKILVYDMERQRAERLAEEVNGGVVELESPLSLPT